MDHPITTAPNTTPQILRILAEIYEANPWFPLPDVSIFANDKNAHAVIAALPGPLSIEIDRFSEAGGPSLVRSPSLGGITWVYVPHQFLYRLRDDISGFTGA